MERVLTLHPDPVKKGVRVDRARYEAVRDAILHAVPAAGDGLPFGRLSDEVRARVPEGLFAGASIAWYTTTVKLDLEARGLLQRLPGSPQRLVRSEPRG